MLIFLVCVHMNVCMCVCVNESGGRLRVQESDSQGNKGFLPPEFCSTATFQSGEWRTCEGSWMNLMILLASSMCVCVLLTGAYESPNRQSSDFRNCTLQVVLVLEADEVELAGEEE